MTDPPSDQPAPRVRIVVVNYNRPELTLRCLDAIRRLEWPSHRLEVVVVDNGSADDSASSIAARHPWAGLIRSERNLGFAGGNNLALADLAAVDYVALLNNDATVEPGWLAPLVATLTANPTAGAACSKVLFAGQFVELVLAIEGIPSRRPQPGVRLSGIEVDCGDRWTDAQFVDGWRGLEHGGVAEASYQWSGARARLRLPVGGSARLRLAADDATPVEVSSGDRARRISVMAEPQWFDVPVAGQAVDVINNAGNRLVVGGYGADRGYLEVDRGQYDMAAEVFGWCGASVLLRPEYLRDVGTFDERLFLYYEDIDLSWRGRARGWRCLYAPGSVVRHIHAATAVEGSPLSAYFVERNRLLVLAKNAPGRLAVGAAARHLAITGSYARRDIAVPLLRRQRIRPAVPLSRLAAFGGYLRLLPSMLATRRALESGRVVPAKELLEWAEPV